MEDITTRLRAELRATRWTRGIDGDYPVAWEPHALCHEAADTIDALRADVERKSDAIQRIWRERDELRAERDALLRTADADRQHIERLNDNDWQQALKIETLTAERDALRAELDTFRPLRAKGVVDADSNLDCWDTEPFEICHDHVAALNAKDPAAMWRVVDLYGRDPAALALPATPTET